MIKFKHHIHDVPSEPMAWMEEDYDRHHTFSKSDIEKFHLGLSTVIEKSLLHKLFVRGCLLNKPKRQIIRHLYDYLQAIMIELQPYINKRSNDAVFFRDKTVLNKSTVLHKLYFSTWAQAFYTTLILRDPFDQLKYLISIDESCFVVNVNAGENDIDLVLYRLFQGFFGQGKKELRTLIGDVIEFSAPEFVGDDEAQDFVNYLYLPLAEMLVYTHSNDRVIKYPQKLLFALESHRSYYTEITGDENKVCSIWGWLSLGITALAAHAYDVFGLESDVDTEYMPLWLVKGEFPSYNEAFPELISNDQPQYKDFMFTSSCADMVNWSEIINATIKWANEEPNLPPVCDVIGRDIPFNHVDKNIRGEIFIDVLGNNPSELKLYSLEPSLIENPEKWLKDMEVKWHEHINIYLADADITTSFMDN
ncbi:Imm49 family immunity protein [Photobacterium nomapromontoriensis]|uniref:Imm49 family immunity protein n=1 Tax=Photobacterium nomapromontoriensis TaxID=2910237 RepID=UPI003D10E866